jgi:hypothetical protein
MVDFQSVVVPRMRVVVQQALGWSIFGHNLHVRRVLIQSPLRYVELLSGCQIWHSADQRPHKNWHRGSDLAERPEIEDGKRGKRNHSWLMTDALKILIDCDQGFAIEALPSLEVLRHGINLGER